MSVTRWDSVCAHPAALRQCQGSNLHAARGAWVRDHPNSTLTFPTLAPCPVPLLLTLPPFGSALPSPLAPFPVPLPLSLPPCSALSPLAPCPVPLPLTFGSAGLLSLAFFDPAFPFCMEVEVEVSVPSSFLFGFTALALVFNGT